MTSPARRIPGTALQSPKRATAKRAVFDVKLFLESNGLGRKITKFRGKETIFSQGDPAKNVIYIQEGGVMDLSPFLRQPVKRQYSANGGEAHGIASTEVHAGI